MGRPIDPCFRQDPYSGYSHTVTTTTVTTTTLPPFVLLPEVGKQCANPPCVCGSVFIPIGSAKANTNNSQVKLISTNGDISIIDLVHNQDVTLEQEQVFITSTKKLDNNDLYVNKIEIITNFSTTTTTNNPTSITSTTTTTNPDSRFSIDNIIQVLIKLKDSYNNYKIIGQSIIGSVNETTVIDNINIPLLETVNLKNTNLQIEFYSLCYNNKTLCCDKLPSISISDVDTFIYCTTSTTTTSTTLFPLCSSLRDTFTFPVYGIGVLDGQVNYNSEWNRVANNIWTTNGVLPCGAEYTLSITCDPINQLFIYDGSVGCCFSNKTVTPPQSSSSLVPFSVTYANCKNCPENCCYSGCDNCDNGGNCGGVTTYFQPTTTTTTTLDPACSIYNLPNSFYCTIIGFGPLSGQQNTSLVTRSGNTWTTTGSFPCGAEYNISMICDPSIHRFRYDGTISCCSGKKSIVDPSNRPYLFPSTVAPPIVWYSNCNDCGPPCTTTGTTTTTTIGPPTSTTSTTTKPPVPCHEIKSITINGYAFYNNSPGTQLIPGVGYLPVPCYGGHVCDRTNFIPQLITPTATISSSPISLNNGSDGGDRAEYFTFDIPDTNILKNGASVQLKCMNSNCHDGVAWLVLTTDIDDQTIVLFNSCVLPDSLDSLYYECKTCCRWNGEGLFLRYVCNNNIFSTNLSFLQTDSFTWEANETLGCGDTIKAIITCDPDIPNLSGRCSEKWKVIYFSMPCATNARLSGNLLEECECNKPPVWELIADSFSNCNCCCCSDKIQKFTYDDDPVENGYDPSTCMSITHRSTIRVPDCYSLPITINVDGGVDDHILLDDSYILEPIQPSHQFNHTWIQYNREFTLSAQNDPTYCGPTQLYYTLTMMPSGTNINSPQCGPIIIIPPVHRNTTTTTCNPGDPCDPELRSEIRVSTYIADILTHDNTNKIILTSNILDAITYNNMIEGRLQVSFISIDSLLYNSNIPQIKLSNSTIDILSYTMPIYSIVSSKNSIDILCY